MCVCVCVVWGLNFGGGYKNLVGGVYCGGRIFIDGENEQIFGWWDPPPPYPPIHPVEKTLLITLSPPLCNLFQEHSHLTYATATILYKTLHPTHIHITLQPLSAYSFIASVYHISPKVCHTFHPHKETDKANSIFFFHIKLYYYLTSLISSLSPHHVCIIFP